VLHRQWREAATYFLRPMMLFEQDTSQPSHHLHELHSLHVVSWQRGQMPDLLIGLRLVVWGGIGTGLSFAAHNPQFGQKGFAVSLGNAGSTGKKFRDLVSKSRHVGAHVGDTRASRLDFGSEVVGKAHENLLIF